MVPTNRMFYWTFCSVSNRYREPSKRILLAVILEKVQHFSWKVQHAFVIAKRSPLYRVYIHALSVHTKSLFLRHFTRIGWDEGGGAVQCSPPPLRPQPSLVSCFLITMQPGQWSVSGLYCIMGTGERRLCYLHLGSWHPSPAQSLDTRSWCCLCGLSGQTPHTKILSLTASNIPLGGPILGLDHPHSLTVHCWV